jgi:hypothetical protein
MRKNAQTPSPVFPADCGKNGCTVSLERMSYRANASPRAMSLGWFHALPSLPLAPAKDQDRLPQLNFIAIL